MCRSPLLLPLPLCLGCLLVVGCGEDLTDPEPILATEFEALFGFWPRIGTLSPCDGDRDNCDAGCSDTANLEDYLGRYDILKLTAGRYCLDRTLEQLERGYEPAFRLRDQALIGIADGEGGLPVLDASNVDVPECGGVDQDDCPGPVRSCLGPETGWHAKGALLSISGWTVIENIEFVGGRRSALDNYVVSTFEPCADGNGQHATFVRNCVFRTNEPMWFPVLLGNQIACRSDCDSSEWWVVFEGNAVEGGFLSGIGNNWSDAPGATVHALVRNNEFSIPLLAYGAAAGRGSVRGVSYGNTFNSSAFLFASTDTVQAGPGGMYGDSQWWSQGDVFQPHPQIGHGLWVSGAFVHTGLPRKLGPSTGGQVEATISDPSFEGSYLVVTGSFSQAGGWSGNQECKAGVTTFNGGDGQETHDPDCLPEPPGSTDPACSWEVCTADRWGPGNTAIVDLRGAHFYDSDGLPRASDIIIANDANWGWNPPDPNDDHGNQAIIRIDDDSDDDDSDDDDSDDDDSDDDSDDDDD